MKAHWVALVAAGTLVVGLVAGGLAGVALGLWVGVRSADARASAQDRLPDRSSQVPGAAPPTAEPLPQLTLDVHSDGCGVVRSEAPPGVHHQALTWVFRDQGGFQVLGRAAESETHYRYFESGRYDVVLEAHDGASYQKVSNEVTVDC